MKQDTNIPTDLELLGLLTLCYTPETEEIEDMLSTVEDESINENIDSSNPTGCNKKSYDFLN